MARKKVSKAAIEAGSDSTEGRVSGSEVEAELVEADVVGEAEDEDGSTFTDGVDDVSLHVDVVDNVLESFGVVAVV